MTCNLIKEVVTLKGNDGKKAKSFKNFYLVFENGTKIKIQCSFYDTEKVTADKAELLEKVNYSNYQLLDAFADLIKDEA